MINEGSDDLNRWTFASYTEDWFSSYLCSPCCEYVFSLCHDYALLVSWLCSPWSTFTHWWIFEVNFVWSCFAIFSLWRCVRGRNRGNWTCRIPKRCFQLFSTPSSGQKWQKTRIFCMLLNRKSPRNLGDGLWKQKMFVYNI